MKVPNNTEYIYNRMNYLYEKIDNDTITEEEQRELDELEAIEQRYMME